MCPYLLHSFWLLGFGSVRVRGSVSGTPLRGDFRGWSTSLLLGTTRIQYTIYDLVNARKGRTWCSEDLLFVFLGFESEFPPFCLTLRQIFA